MASATALGAINGPSTAPASSSNLNNGVLTQNDFIKLITAQLKNQDPLNPTDTSTFTSQLTQFSSMNSMNQLNTNLTNMLLLQGLTQGTNLIGKSISFVPSGANQPSTGVVNSLSVVNGNIQLVVNGAQAPVALNQVLGVK